MCILFYLLILLTYLYAVRCVMPLLQLIDSEVVSDHQLVEPFLVVSLKMVC